MKNKQTLLTASIVLLVLALAGCGLSSEPQIAREIPLPTSAPAIASPATMPDLTQGAAFFAEHCVMCHGPNGAGDGEMVQDGRLASAPPSFLEADTVRSQSPQDFMRAITDGNVLSGMPPFSSYAEQSRWDAAAYVYTGHYTADQLAAGAQIYETSCASCHGPEGQGDGPDAPSSIMPDLTGADFWAENSDAVLYQKISGGIMLGMPGFGEDLSEAEIWAVIGHVRTFALEGTPGFSGAADAVEQASSEDADSTGGEALDTTGGDETAGSEMSSDAVGEEASAPEIPESITVTGQVTNGSAGGVVPIGATITLHAFDPPEYTESSLFAEIAEDGTYTFTDVPHQLGRVYLLSLEQDDVYFSSTVYPSDTVSGDQLETTIEMFDVTSDPSGIWFEAGVMRVMFSQFGMEVAQVLSLVNDTDKLFLTDDYLTENQRIALEIPLPPGAVGVGFEPGMQGTRFYLNEDESVVIDTQPVRPGSEEILMTYLIPYEDGAVIEQEMAYTFKGPFHLLVEAGQVQVTPGDFEMVNDQVDMGGDLFEAYVAELDLAPGEALSFTLSGMPDVIAAANQGQTGSATGGTSPLVLALLAGGVILLGIGGFLFLLRQGVADPVEQEIDDLLQEIADLDDRYERGMLNHDYYGRTRESLKAQLAELMSQSAAGDSSSSPDDTLSRGDT